MSDSPSPSRHKPLAGIRVLTVDNYFAGNYGPLLLAAHGAEVIKIEQPGSGDPLRKDAPYYDPDTKKLPHGVLRLMRGKGSVALDIRKEPGKSIMRELLTQVDVFWTNLRPQAAKRIDLDPETVQGINPDIIYASVSGFGLPGEKASPFSNEPAFDIIIQALTGLMSRNADPDGTPQYSGLAIGDQVTSLYTAFGVVMSLYARKLGMPAATVDVAMFDAMFALNEKTFSLFTMDGVVRPPRISATNSPFGAYKGKDGYLVIGVGGNILWERFCKAIGREDLWHREDLNTGVKRVAAEKSIIRPCIEAWLRDKTVREASQILLAHEVPSSPILDVDSPIYMEQAKIRGVANDLDIPGKKPLTLVQSPVRLWNQEPENLAMPPALGADTERILRDWLKKDEAQLAALRQAGAIN